MAMWSRRRDWSKRLDKAGSRLSVQRLEDRLALSVSPNGDSFLVNDFTAGDQSADGASVAVAASPVNRVVVYEGRGPQDRDGVFARLYDDQGAAVGDAFRVNTTIRGEQYAPAVAVESDGDFIIAWAGRGIADKSGIFIQRYESDGTRVGDEIIVNSTLGGTQTSPSIAVNDSGAFVVAWEGAGRGDTSGVFFRRFNTDGALGTEARANTTTDDHQRSTSVAFLESGEFVIGWQSRHQDGSDWSVQSQLYNSVGLRVGDEFQLNSTTDQSQSEVALAADPDGGYVATWQSRGQDGDGWGIVGRRIGADGTTADAEVVINEATAGDQVAPAIAVAEDGQWIAAWASGSSTRAGWETLVRSIEADGTTNAAAVVPSQAAGFDADERRTASVAVVGDKALVVWSGNGASDNDGVHAQSYDVVVVDDGPNVAPELAAITDRDAEVGNVVEVVVTATDANTRDQLTFTLDADNSPTGATIVQTGNNRAVVRWTPAAADDGTTVGFRVLVTDDDATPLSDAETFSVVVADAPLAIDLNGFDVPGNRTEAVFVVGDAALQAVAPQLVIGGARDGMIQSSFASIFFTPDGDAEMLSVSTEGTNITANYDSSVRRLFLTGEDTVENYQRVLRTLIYNNTNPDASGTRGISVRVADADGNSRDVATSLTITNPNLASFAQALTNAGVRLYGRAASPETTAQRDLFDDGAQLLSYTERSDAPAGLNLTDDVTWIFNQGETNEIRLEGLQTLFRLAQAAGIDLPTSDTPTVLGLQNETLLVGSPLHVPLDGYDSNGGPLTYEVSVTGNSGVTAEVLSGNRSIRFEVASPDGATSNVHDYGDLVFELFEQRASRATDRMIELAEADFFDGQNFHRIVNDFAVQGGAVNDDGSGDPGVDTFDDQFHVDLQHNRTGLLSSAKTSADDSNTSQFFITEGDNTESLRNLDFNHTVFGLLTEGELARAAISDVPVQNNGFGEVSDPIDEVRIRNAEVFTDTENAVLMLKAADGAAGTATITVTVRDAQGNSSQQSFQVTLAPDDDPNPATAFDPSNGRPFLEDIPPVTSPSGTPATFQLTGVDAEGDPVFYAARAVGAGGHTATVDANGEVTVTPVDGFTGTVEIEVSVGRTQRATPSSADDLQRLTVTFG